MRKLKGLDDFDMRAIELAGAIVELIEMHGFEFVLHPQTEKALQFHHEPRMPRNPDVTQEEANEAWRLILAGTKAGGPKLETVNGEKRAGFNFAIREKGSPRGTGVGAIP